MNNRQRFPGNGYRSNAIPSRISPETSIRSQPNFYNLDNRSFHRPFGRMHPKSPLPMQHQPLRKGNLFIEAGRLAVDYLVCHGLLPPDVLSNPPSNGNLKAIDNFEFNQKHQVVTEDLNSPKEGQSTAPSSFDRSLSANDASEAGRRSPVHVKENRRLTRPLSSPDLSDENGRDRSLPEKANKSDNVITNSCCASTQQNVKELNTNIDGDHIKQCQDKQSLTSQKNNGPSSAGESTDQLSSIHVKLEKESRMSHLGEEDAEKNSTIHFCVEEADSSRKDHNGLLTFGDSELPTKSFTSFRPADLSLVMQADGSNKIGQSGSAAQFTSPAKKTLTSDIPGSLSDEFCGSVDKGRGQKRTLENKDESDNPKKVKDWSTDLHTGESPHHSGLENNLLGSQELIPLPGRVAMQAVDQDSVAIGSMLQSVDIGSSVAYSEEKQLFPGSFKICDLNLMEVSDAIDPHDDSAIAYSSNQVPKKDVSVDIDLSMSNSCTLSRMYSKYEGPGKGVEIIDLECDPLQGDKDGHNSARRMQAEFSGLDNFPNHLQNSSENPDVQDGYGLMLSEMIGNDIPNCSSAQPEIGSLSSLHSEIGLHHGEGLLSDDDQIFMSLGEIPISLLRSWDPPTQDYEKPF